MFIGRYPIVNLFLFFMVFLFSFCIAVSLRPRKVSVKVKVPQESVELCDDRYGEIGDTGQSTLSPIVNCNPNDEGNYNGEANMNSTYHSSDVPLSGLREPCFVFVAVL